MGLFGRAKNLIKGLGSLEEPKVQYYNVLCPLGHRVRGQRTEGYQALRCPACGEGVFVLPLSPLPEPIAPARSNASPRRERERARAATASMAVEEGPVELRDPGEATVEMAEDNRRADVEIIWDDEAGDAAAPTETSAAPASPARDKASKPRGRADATRTPRAEPRNAGRKPDRRATAEGEGPEFAAPRRRRPLNRPVVVFLVVGLLVVGTIALRTWRDRRQQYPLLAEIGRVEGIPALERGDFDKAYQLLAPAKTAVDALGGAVEGADEIRIAADEAAVFINLLPESLEELLDQAARTNPQTWASRFDDQYKGRGVILDSRIRSTPSSTENRYELDYLVMPLGEAANFRGAGARPERTARIALDDFVLVQLAEPKVGDHVLFGARLASFEFDADSGSWLIRLQPKSGVFIQHHKALETLGWPETSEIPPDPGGPR